jgi:hypothetical protein
MLAIRQNYRMIFLSVLVTALSGCVAAASIVTESVAPGDLRESSYTLYLYGCRYPSDVQNIAFLVPEKAGRTFEIYDLATSFKVKQGLSAQEATRDADTFVRCSFRRVIGTKLQRVGDRSGATLAYEIRPLYSPLEFGQLDVLQVTYSLTDGSVRTRIRLDPDIERALEASGSDDKDSGK